MTKPTVPEVLPLVRAVYDRPMGVCGCCLHVMIDDPNYDDHTAAFCLQYARELGHPECIALAEKMILMSPTQRKVLSNRYHSESQ